MAFFRRGKWSVLLLAALLSSCADTATPDRAADRTEANSRDEVGAHQGQVCPKWLPQDDGPGPGLPLGAREPATSAPSFPSIETAWICPYIPAGGGPEAEPQARAEGWLREGAAFTVPPREVPELERRLNELKPASYDGFCTADLGRRYVLVFSHNRDLTGVVLDDFGCRDARLTDEPFTTAPGYSTQAGIVPGVLQLSGDLLDELKRLYPAGEGW